MRTATEHQSGLHFVLQAVADRLLGMFKGPDDVFHVAPETGSYQHAKYLVAVGGNYELLVGLALCGLDIVQLHDVLQAAY